MADRVNLTWNQPTRQAAFFPISPDYAFSWKPGMIQNLCDGPWVSILVGRYRVICTR